MEQSNNKEVSRWLAQSLRFTGFLMPGVAVNPGSLWEQIVGAVPEASVSRKDIGLQQLEGPFSSGRLSLILLPGRIDWNLNASPRFDVEGVASLGSFEDAVGVLRPVVQSWFQTGPAFSRVALGAVLVQPVESVQNGYRKLAKYLEQSVHLDPESSSEFSYTINRPRVSKMATAEMILNRLSKWSVSAIQTVHINVAAGTPPATMVQSEYCCRLELDLSTPAAVQPELSGTYLTDIFDELVALGHEIAQFGDVP